jgi:hypothetical protein
VTSTIDWAAIKKAAQKSRNSSRGGKAAVALMREKAKTSSDYAVLVNPGRGFASSPKSQIAFHGRKVSD